MHVSVPRRTDALPVGAAQPQYAAIVSVRGGLVGVADPDEQPLHDCRFVDQLARP
ncbi:hypothetical protein EDD90_10652 [Streptomyces sp. Ag109_O5-1]|uniref:hypothetical protein n=1 Tax=Streptomyces sp. Ag109_O5-1 TaxID=1938851 RepID=UPI000F97625C|nr:hypothetical protein [Streptomyces sp. Ag109_O5-1]RPE47199.1 hypothetical protein EDD90_10652 [Streptomyces sp. Ag109_O5-1]